ncbi:MAG: DUF805 domain-containing protein [Paludibacter sp.]|nr:DUF805 domain-containing protein [Paludibacter sp.]
MNWYLKVLKQYVDFSGRARRTEYWMFALMSFLFSITLALIDYLMGTMVMGSGILSGLYSLAVIIPGLAVTARRLHDIGKSGKWFFIAFIPVVGAIWLLVLLVTNGQVGENKYGADPKTEVIA